MLSLRSIPGISFAQASLVRMRPILRVKAAYRETFEPPAGQMVLRDIARRGGMFETSMEPDAHMTSFKEGRRSLALEIFQMLRWSDGEIAQLATQRDPDQLAAAREEEAL